MAAEPAKRSIRKKTCHNKHRNLARLRAQRIGRQAQAGRSIAAHHQARSCLQQPRGENHGEKMVRHSQTFNHCLYMSCCQWARFTTAHVDNQQGNRHALARKQRQNTLTESGRKAQPWRCLGGGCCHTAHPSAPHMCFRIAARSAQCHGTLADRGPTRHVRATCSTAAPSTWVPLSCLKHAVRFACGAVAGSSGAHVGMCCFDDGMVVGLPPLEGVGVGLGMGHCVLCEASCVTPSRLGTGRTRTLVPTGCVALSSAGISPTLLAAAGSALMLSLGAGGPSTSVLTAGCAPAPLSTGGGGGGGGGADGGGKPALPVAATTVETVCQGRVVKGSCMSCADKTTVAGPPAAALPVSAPLAAGDGSVGGAACGSVPCQSVPLLPPLLQLPAWCSSRLVVSTWPCDAPPLSAREGREDRRGSKLAAPDAPRD